MEPSQISERLKNPKSDDFFVLDIDSTLVTTFQRNQAILERFIKDHSKKYPLECQSLAQACCQLGDYGIETALNRIAFKSDNSEFLDFLMGYWRDRFFTNDFLSSDQPTEGAVEWTNSLYQKGIHFIYLTARHHSKMWPGTLSSMKALGFPIDEQNLYLKKDLSVSDEIYKTQTIRELVKKLENKKLWLIDNEPVVLNKISSDHPNIQLVWFESCHSQKMTPPKGVPSIKSFLFK